MRDEVVWDDEERDDVMSMTKSHELPILPKSSHFCQYVFTRVKEWKEKGKESTWQQQALQTPPFSVSTSCAYGLPSMASPLLPQCSYYACSHSLCLRA